MKFFYLQISFCLLLMICFSCNPDKEKNENKKAEAIEIATKYAKLFSIEKFESYTKLTVKNPWQGAENVTMSYYLVEKSADKSLIPTDGRVIEVPLANVACMSTTYLACIDLLGRTDAVSCISGSDYIYNESVRKRIDKKSVVDVGSPDALNYELLLARRVDALFTYTVTAGTSSVVDKLEEIGVPVVLNADYLETHVLGKAEWLKFMALFFGEYDKAVAHFDSIEANYFRLKALVDSLGVRPRVFCNTPYKDTWYVPGGKSYLAAMIADAGGDYVWADDSSEDVIALNLESVLQKAADADIWINTGVVDNRADMLKIDERMAFFRAYKAGQLYNNNARKTIAGGNDFWESGMLYPDVILADLIKIFHPELFEVPDLFYYHKLNNDL